MARQIKEYAEKGLINIIGDAAVQHLSISRQLQIWWRLIHQEN